MKIVLATPIYPPEIGGPATYVRELATRLAKAEQITIVAFADVGEVVDGVKLVLIGKKSGLLSRLTAFFFALLKEAKGANVIYVQNAVAAGLPAVLAGALLKKPVVLKFVGDEAWERAAGAGKTQKTLEQFLAAPEGGVKTSIFIAIQKFVLTHASVVVPPSQFLGNILTQYYGVSPTRVLVNYNAFEDPIPNETPTNRQPQQILSVSRLVSWKRVDGIINAFKILKNTFSGATLVIAGVGPEEASLKKLAQESGLDQSVRFVGRLSHEQVLELEKESDVMVLNSTYEGLPHIVLEGFAARTPVIATDIPGTREAVMHEKSGILVPKGDDATLAVAIERVFNDAALREKIVVGGLLILKEKFSWEQHLTTLLAVFASAEENKGT